MSQLASDPDQPRSTPILDEKQSESFTRKSWLQLKANGGIERPADIPMNESRASGELEGSTLGSSSRDGDARSREQRRTHSSNGFLLDSALLPRTKSLRTSHHRPRRPEPVTSEKRRAAPEPDPVLPKKKSRFPWSRHKHSATESSAPVSAATASSATNAQENTPSGSEAQGPATSTDQDATPNTDQGTFGLDKESMRIVKLALNLNESRKRGSSVRSNLGQIPGGRRAVSAQSSGAYSPVTVGNLGQHPFQAHNTSPRTYVDDQFRSLDSPRVKGQGFALNQLPGPIDGDTPLYPCSKATLQRAEKARLHFELFNEYLRLLPSLPPLRHPTLDSLPDPATTSNDGGPGGRVYNPLQAIRNRKVRFRERCAIDPEACGWNDMERVREWVSTVEEQYDEQDHDSVECLRLPPFHQEQIQDLQEEQGNADMYAVSPPSSLRRVSHASSGVKPRRPRLDWIISPAELLADAAWVEEDFNKSKIVDKEGNKLYPDLGELVPVDGDLGISPSQNWALSGQRGSMDMEPHGPRMSSFQLDRSPDLRGLGRGRPRHRSRSPSRLIGHSSSTSRRGREPKWLRSRARSTSSSSISFPEDRYRYKRNARHRLTKQADGGTVDPNFMRAQGSGPPWLRSRGDRGKTKLGAQTGSISSIASNDARYVSGMSREAMDINLQPGTTFFPSIAVDLSPPSSRSSSPAKKHLPRMIDSIRDRSRSKHRNKESRERIDSELLASESLRKRSTEMTLEFPPHVGRLDQSPLPDRFSSSYREDQPTYDIPWVDGSKAQKAPFQSESKLRGIFKGRGRIAEIVGNEVSKVGDFLKKDPTAQGRKLSSTASLTSDDGCLGDGEGAKNDLKSSLFRRLPALSDDSRLARSNSDKGASKSYIPNLPTFTPSVRPADQDERGEVSDNSSPRQRGTTSRIGSKPDAPTPVDRASESLVVPTIQTEDTNSQIKDPAALFPASPPVTGLANADATPVPSSQGERPRLADSSRAWSISDRSVATLASFGLPDKREIERTRALLLCSGIKAREITRRAGTVRYPPPDFLLKSLVDPTAPVPRVTRIDEHEYAARNLVERFEKSKLSLQQSMDRLSNTTCAPLKSQLNNLEILVNQSLTRRVREAAADADSLSIQLNTTTTLAVKQLSDVLDRAVRRRHHRLRLVRCAGFVLLEWVLVAVMWWVWLVVMIFKIIRGVFRGAVSGIKWVLWL